MCNAACTPWLHLRMEGGQPNVTFNGTSMTFTCPDGGCGGGSECLGTTAPANVCEYGFVDGRPFVDERGPVFAAVTQSNGSCWASPVPSVASRAPSPSELPEARRQSAAQRWRLAGLTEHASVASFSRASLELMAVGAPADLLADTHQAALDEIRHAKVAFGLAQYFGGDAAAPGPLPIGTVAVATSLAELAARTYTEGCVGETLSVARVQLQLLAGDFLPEEEAAMRAVFADEARHSALAWRTVAWAWKHLGDEL